jgi:uncharacterized membrane protein YeiH
MEVVDVDAASDIALIFLQVVGTITFAISGTLAAGRRKMDWLGVLKEKD